LRRLARCSEKRFSRAAALKAAVYFEDGDLAALSRADRATLIAAASAVGPLPSAKLRSRSLAIAIGGRSVPRITKGRS
jgi:hypothetical protein